MKNTERSAIDLMKIVCAILVIGIHTEPFGRWELFDQMFGVLTRIAVPYFFVSSA